MKALVEPIRRDDFDVYDSSSYVKDVEGGGAIGYYQRNTDANDSTVTIFGKYEGTYKTLKECQAFADGVVAVLNFVTSFPKTKNSGEENS